MLHNLINYSYWAGVTEMAMKSGTSCGSTTAVKTTGRKMHMNRFWSNYNYLQQVVGILTGENK